MHSPRAVRARTRPRPGHSGDQHTNQDTKVYGDTGEDIWGSCPPVVGRAVGGSDAWLLSDRLKLFEQFAPERPPAAAARDGGKNARAGSFKGKGSGSGANISLRGGSSRAVIKTQAGAATSAGGYDERSSEDNGLGTFTGPAENRLSIGLGEHHIILEKAINAHTRELTRQFALKLSQTQALHERELAQLQTRREEDVAAMAEELKNGLAREQALKDKVASTMSDLAILSTAYEERERELKASGAGNGRQFSFSRRSTLSSFNIKGARKSSSASSSTLAGNKPPKPAARSGTLTEISTAFEW